MAGSSFGNIFKITTWGESHGKALGVVIDGCPAGLELDESDIQKYLDRRKPGSSSITTPRKESDLAQILSGVFEGRTTGTPISIIVENTSQISKDYNEIAMCYRPGHADYTFDQKYGFRDYRGGGRSSGRETIGRVAAGAIACKILDKLGISVYAYTKSIGNITIDQSIDFNTSDTSLLNKYREASLSTPTAMPDIKADEKALELISNARKDYDSLGGVIECVVRNMPTGIGDPVFEKLDANLSKAIMSIGAVKAIEIGAGIKASQSYGSENNDEFQITQDNKISKLTNNAGGILGGISDGSNIILRAYIKPTPSIFKPQKTVNTSGENIELKIKGRHDPVIMPRAAVVVECMTAITLLDSIMINMSSRLDRMIDFYK